jgi:hypothetical protein
VPIWRTEADAGIDSSVGAFCAYPSRPHGLPSAGRARLVSSRVSGQAWFQSNSADRFPLGHKPYEPSLL